MSRHATSFSLCLLIACGLSFTTSVEAAQPSKAELAKKALDRVKPVPAQASRPRVNGGSILDRIPRIDPAVTSLQVRLVRKISDYEARIAIVGVVKNLGNKDFRSSPGQQSATLLRRNQGIRVPVTIKQQRFTNLDAGESFVVVHQLTWSTSIEFPPSFELFLNYDPDIRIDANPNNDDAIPANNSKKLDGMKLNEIVRQLLR